MSVIDALQQLLRGRMRGTGAHWRAGAVVVGLAVLQLLGERL